MRPVAICIALIAAVLIVFTAIVIIPAIHPVSVPGPEVQPLSIAIVTTSGFESAVLPTEPDKDLRTGGIAAIGGEYARIRTEYNRTFLVSGGNNVMGAWYSLFGGEPEYGAMSLAGYDAVCPGNHEFDQGHSSYLGALGFTTFPVVCSNIEIDDPVLRNRIQKSAILNRSGIQVGVFGLMTPELPRVSSPGPGVRVNPGLAAVCRDTVRELRDKEAPIVILLSHAGITADRELARTIDGIDVIVTAPGKEALYEAVTGPSGKTCMVIGSGMKGREIGVLSFQWDGKVIIRPHWQVIPVTINSPRDSKVESFLAPFKQQYETRFSVPLAISTKPLEARAEVIRSQETNMGDLIADAMQSRFNAVDAALINSGGIRGDRVWPAGNISFRLISEILPFGDSATLLTLQGRTLQQVLEISAASLPGNSSPCSGGIVPGPAGFLQVSGLRFTVDPSRTPFCARYNGTRIERVIQQGDRIREVTILRNGEYEPLDPEALYTVVVSDFIATGGDGHAPLADVPDNHRSDTRIAITDILADYLSEQRVVAPVTDGRITILPQS